LGIQASAARSAGQASPSCSLPSFPARSGSHPSAPGSLGFGQTATKRLFIEAIQRRMVGLGYLVKSVPAVQQRPDVLLGLTDLDAGQCAIEAEATQQIAVDLGNPCLFCGLSSMPEK
jgi:hypothetical protein